MLKMVATLDWRQIKKGMFITLTMPDEAWPMNVLERNQAKYVFFRNMEKHLGHQVGALWRIEWKKRLTGKYLGKILPHWHLIVPGVAFIPKEKVLAWWRDALHVKGHLMTRVDKLSDRTKHQVYICKYCAKLPEHTGLDYVAYLNITGRHWGYQRKHLIPTCPLLEIDDLDIYQVQQLRRAVERMCPWYDAEVDAGFSTFGKRSETLLAMIRDLGLDGGKLRA